MVSHTSVTNVTARGPLGLHLTTRLGPAPVNGHRNLPGYVKNGSVSENSIPSSGQELHIPAEEHSAHTRPCEDEKPSPVVEEERETVMWPAGRCLCRWKSRKENHHETVSGCLHASTLPVFFSCELSRNIAKRWGSRQKGRIAFAGLFDGWWLSLLQQITLSPTACHTECVKCWEEDCRSLLLIHCHNCCYPSFMFPLEAIILWSFFLCISKNWGFVVTTMAKNTLNHQSKARWVLSALRGKNVGNLIRKFWMKITCDFKTINPTCWDVFMFPGVESHLFCIGLNPLQRKREVTQVIEVLCCCTPIFILFKWCFSIVSFLLQRIHVCHKRLFCVSLPFTHRSPHPVFSPLTPQILNG